ncbi:MAG: hypothetical protein JO264_09645 [Acidisphaera sp.]|nr:hypothetical protein [Acidisphaera sp.]
MRRGRNVLVRVLALLLFVQWGTLFSHCLALTELSQPVCSDAAMPGMPMPHHGPAPEKAHSVCPVCQGLATAAVPPAVRVPEPFVYSDARPVETAAAPLLPRLVSLANRARAPPIG